MHMRYTMVVLAAATALSVAACGSSNNSPAPAAPGTSSPAASGPSSTPAPTSTAPATGGMDHVAGLISAVSGNAIQVTQRNGNATVDFTGSTTVAQIAPATLTDVTAGSCVMVRPTRDSAPASSGSITAQAVLIGTPTNGNCGQPQGGPAGQGGPGGPGGPPGGPGGPGGHWGAQPVRGTVASVNGDTITVTTTGNPSQVNVSATNTTNYAKHTVANTQAITQGQCLAARGTKDGSGTLQAVAIILRPANNGSCGGGRH
jgi:hypothetical protein